MSNQCLRWPLYGGIDWRGDRTVSVADGYNEVATVIANLQLTISLMMLKAASCFLAHHEQEAPDILSFLCAAATFDRYCNVHVH